MIHRLFTLLLSLLFVGACISPNPKATEEVVEEKVEVETDTQRAIKQLIEDAYVAGLQNEGDTLAIDRGFHPDFVMTGRDDEDNVWKFPITEWRKRKIESVANGDLPRGEESRVSVEFDFVDVTDDVAMVKLRYFEGGKHTYTDYISLYQIQGEWKIISKVFTKID